MMRIAPRQRNCDYPSAGEVRDQASLLFRARTRTGRPFGKHWWRCFKRHHAGQTDIISCPSQEPTRNVFVGCDVNIYFSALLLALSRCVTPG
jgi:hypothetical protein